MKGNLKRIIKRIKIFVYEQLAIVAKKFSRFVYRQLFLAEWEIIDPPENFDHEIDLYYQWDKNCLPYWVERGVYSVQALKIFEKPIVIELCCGDGFNAKHFYATSAFRVMACDFDKNIIKTAIRKNSCKNVIYKTADIRDGIEQIFRKEKCTRGVTNIIWDAAMEHFTVSEIDNILKDIKRILLPQKGILSGYTIVESTKGKSNPHHEYEFKSKEDLYRFFVPYFKNIYVFETIYSDRHNLYFYASDGIIPFNANWEHGMNHMQKNE